MTSNVLEALERMLDGGGEPDDVLRAAVSVLAEEPGVAWVGIAFLDEGALVVGPAAGEPDVAHRIRVPIAFQGSAVGELWVDGAANPALLERAATLLSAHVLIGWDTKGEKWEP